jgi:hypothetical protein
MLYSPDAATAPGGAPQPAPAAPQPMRDSPSQPNYAAGAFQIGGPQPGAPQPVQHQPPQPNYPQGYPAPGAAPQGVPPGASATQRTRTNADDGLDTPPKNKMPIYAAIVGAVIVAIIVIVMLAK